MEQTPSAFLKAKMKETDITYAELAKRLKKHGLKETEAGFTMKAETGDVYRNILSCVYCGAGTRTGSIRGDLESPIGDL
jgi:hypothetical protein